MIFGNPVRGTIHGETWKRPDGNIDFRVTQPFGCTGFYREPPLGECAHFHRGIDLGNARCYSVVVAAESGTVHYSGKLANGENVVIINHGNGWATLYGHLASRAVAKGAVIAKGGAVGTVGRSGNATACHLHFAVKSGVDFSKNTFADSNGTWLDPWPRLAQNVTIRPKGPDINIRWTAGSGTTLGKVYATTDDDGHIRRSLDNTDLGETAVFRKWGGTVKGARYRVGDVTSDQWDKMLLAGSYRYIASLLVYRSMS